MLGFNHYCLALLALVAVQAADASAAQVTYGLGVAGRAGYYNGLSSAGGEVNLRIGKVEFAAGVMQGYEDVSDSIDQQVGDSFWFDDNSVDVETARLNQESQYLQLKLHPMNGSFFFGLGAGRSTTKGRINAVSELSSQTLTETHTITRDYTTFSVGNIWTPGGVIIGCEWAGVSAARNVKSETESTSSELDEEDMLDAQETFYEKVRDTGGKSTSHALVLHLGYMLGW